MQIFNPLNTLLPQQGRELHTANTPSWGEKIFPWVHSQSPFTTGYASLLSTSAGSDVNSGVHTEIVVESQSQRQLRKGGNPSGR